MTSQHLKIAANEYNVIHFCEDLFQGMGLLSKTLTKNLNAEKLVRLVYQLCQTISTRLVSIKNK